MQNDKLNIQYFSFYYQNNIFNEFILVKKEDKEKLNIKNENKEINNNNLDNKDDKIQPKKKKSMINKIPQKKPLKKIERIKSLPIPKIQSKKDSIIQKTNKNLPKQENKQKDKKSQEIKKEKDFIKEEEIKKETKEEDKKEEEKKEENKIEEKKEKEKITEIKKPKKDIIIQISEPNIIDISSFPDTYHSHSTIQKMTLSLTFDPHINYIHCLLKLQDCRIASSSSDETIKIFNKETFELDKTLKGHYGGIFNLYQLPNTNLLSASADNTIRLWDINTNQNIKTFIGHFFPVYKVIGLINNKEICSCSADKNIKIWNIENTECIKTLKGHEGYVTAFIEYEKDKLISVGNDDTIRFWNINLNNELGYDNFMILKKIGNFQDHNGLIKIKNNKVIISGNADGTLIIVNVKYYQIECRVKVHVGYTNSIIVMDDNSILTSGDDVILKQWDLDTYIQIGERNNFNINWIISMVQIDDKNGKKRFVGCTLDNNIHVFEY